MEDPPDLAGFFYLNMRIARYLLLLSILILASSGSGVTAPVNSTLTSVRDTLSRAPTDILTDDTSRIIVRIESRTVLGRRINDTLDVTLESFGSQIAGFDFKIGTNTRYLNIIKVLPGRIVDSCRWELFSARPVGTDTLPDRPSQLWHAVGLAKMFIDSTTPTCFGFDTVASILRLVVSNEHILQMPETTAAIFFFWEDCRDNTLSGRSGRSLAISSHVLDFYPVDLPEAKGALPTRRGAPNQCIVPSKPNVPIRRIEFRNGGIQYVIRTPDSDRKILETKDAVSRDTLGVIPDSAK